ncbi:uncharacterized protein At2g23090-like [Tripterygium wilfordii]|uniref:uncharacterized protein At2g23090-like n=1 Tax=Tripterygium wilfordii TaxID=458696 RepID=UPI0018F80020|nr:uncharacterized protein At2g23090-like [Tripterygium wilfordii]
MTSRFTETGRQRRMCLLSKRRERYSDYQERISQSRGEQSIFRCYSFGSLIGADLGGGNGQKAKMAREKNLEMSKASKGSQIETHKKAMSIQCKVFMQTFTCTTTEVKCKEHAEVKHPKSDVYACFPKLVQGAC